MEARSSAPIITCLLGLHLSRVCSIVENTDALERRSVPPMLAQDGRVLSLNLAPEADPHTQSQETRLVGRDGPQSSLRRSRRHEPTRVMSDQHISRSSGLSGGHHGRNAKQQPTKLAGSCKKRSTPCRRLTFAKKRAQTEVLRSMAAVVTHGSSRSTIGVWLHEKESKKA